MSIVLADGKATLGNLIVETALETFEAASDIKSELNNVLPRVAVGEPYQSEGTA